MDETRYRLGAAPKLLHPTRPPETVPPEWFRTIYCWQDPQNCRWRWTFCPANGIPPHGQVEMDRHDLVHAHG